MATGVLIQHKAKKKRKEKRQGMEKMERVMHCRARWEDEATLEPACSCRCRAVWQNMYLKTCMFNCQLGLLALVAIFKNKTKKGTEAPVHDLVNLSCDYLLNTNKQTKSQSVVAPLTRSLCSSCPLW